MDFSGAGALAKRLKTPRPGTTPTANVDAVIDALPRVRRSKGRLFSLTPRAESDALSAQPATTASAVSVTQETTKRRPQSSSALIRSASQSSGAVALAVPALHSAGRRDLLRTSRTQRLALENKLDTEAAAAALMPSLAPNYPTPRCPPHIMRGLGGEGGEGYPRRSQKPDALAALRAALCGTAPHTAGTDSDTSVSNKLAKEGVLLRRLRQGIRIAAAAAAAAAAVVAAGESESTAKSSAAACHIAPQALLSALTAAAPGTEFELRHQAVASLPAVAPGLVSATAFWAALLRGAPEGAKALLGGSDELLRSEGGSSPALEADDQEAEMSVDGLEPKRRPGTIAAMLAAKSQATRALCVTTAAQDAAAARSTALETLARVRALLAKRAAAEVAAAAASGSSGSAGSTSREQLADAVAHACASSGVAGSAILAVHQIALALNSLLALTPPVTDDEVASLMSLCHVPAASLAVGADFLEKPLYVDGPDFLRLLDEGATVGGDGSALEAAATVPELDLDASIATLGQLVRTARSSSGGSARGGNALLLLSARSGSTARGGTAGGSVTSGGGVRKRPSTAQFTPRFDPLLTKKAAAAAAAATRVTRQGSIGDIGAASASVKARPQTARSTASSSLSAASAAPPLWQQAAKLTTVQKSFQFGSLKATKKQLRSSYVTSAGANVVDPGTSAAGTVDKLSFKMWKEKALAIGRGEI